MYRRDDKKLQFRDGAQAEHFSASQGAGPEPRTGRPFSATQLIPELPGDGDGDSLVIPEGDTWRASGCNWVNMYVPYTAPQSYIKLEFPWCLWCYRYLHRGYDCRR